MNDTNPLVTIVLPTYNGARFLPQAIDSCLRQTYTRWELIIIDDGSSEPVCEIVRTFQDARISVVRLDENQGHIAALNRGFALSRGELLTWTSDDNYYAPDAIQEMVALLVSSPGIDFVYTRYYVVDEGGLLKREGRVEPPSYLDVDNCVGGCFLYRRKVYEAVGDFNKEAFLAEDYEYWLRVRAQFTMHKIDKPLYFYRDHPGSLTGIHKEEQVQRQVQKIRRRFLPLSKKMYFFMMRHMRRLKPGFLNRRRAAVNS